MFFFFFFQAEDGIRDTSVTGVQTCALPISVEVITIWLGNIVDLLEPDVIIIGGGVATMLNPFFGKIREQLPAWSLNKRCLEIPMVLARYGAESGIAGGAALCMVPGAA